MYVVWLHLKCISKLKQTLVRHDSIQIWEPYKAFIHHLLFHSLLFEKSGWILIYTREYANGWKYKDK